MQGVIRSLGLVRRKPEAESSENTADKAKEKSKTMTALAVRLVSLVSEQDKEEHIEVAKLVFQASAEEYKQDTPGAAVAWAARAVAKKLVKQAFKFVVKQVVKRAARLAIRMAVQTLKYLGRLMFRWVIRPLLMTVGRILVANPLTAAVLAVGVGGYMIWDEFFSASGKAKRQAEADTMPEFETQPDITEGGAAGVATPEMRRRARESRPEREAAAPIPTAEQSKALGRKPEAAAAPRRELNIGDHKLGATSMKYESRGGPGVVSSGKGDKGGISYGAYQFASKEGIPEKYIAWSSKYGPEFKGLVVNSPEFIAKWKEIAARDPKGFFDDQHAYTQSKYYDLALSFLRRKGLDLGGRGPAIQDMIWSTSVQLGPGVPAITAALKGQDLSKLTDSQIVTLVQDYKEANVESLFRSSPTLWPGLRTRAKNEKADLLALDAAWQKKQASGQASTTSASDQKVAMNDIPPTEREKQQAMMQQHGQSQAGRAVTPPEGKEIIKQNGRLIAVKAA